MLQVSNSAVAALEEARSAQQVPAEHGVRISTQPSLEDPSSVALALGFTDAPADDDLVTEQGGTRLFVAAELAEPLAETVLDVEDGPEGAELVLRPQAAGA